MTCERSLWRRWNGCVWVCVCVGGGVPVHSNGIDVAAPSLTVTTTAASKGKAGAVARVAPSLPPARPPPSQHLMGWGCNATLSRNHTERVCVCWMSVWLIYTRGWGGGWWWCMNCSTVACTWLCLDPQEEHVCHQPICNLTKYHCHYAVIQSTSAL